MITKTTPGPWHVRTRTVDGEIVGCFVSAPPTNGLPYGAEILGDDEYNESGGSMNTPIITAAGLKEADATGDMSVPFDGLLVKSDAVELHLGGECMMTIAMPQLVAGGMVFKLSGLEGKVHSRNAMAAVAPVAGPSNAMAAMAREYMDWIDFYHAGNGDFADFLKQRASAKS